MMDDLELGMISSSVDLAAVDRVLSTTRSVRRRLDFDRAVEPEIIERCIDLATQAPTGIAGENWRFIVVTSPEKKRALAHLYRDALRVLGEVRGGDVKASQQALADRLHEVPALILVCGEGTPPSGSVAMQVGYFGSILPAAWSLMLALRARGLGATWTSLLTSHSDEVARILAIPEGVTQTVLLPVGYTKGAVLRPARRRSANQVTYWDAWGVTRDEGSG